MEGAVASAHSHCTQILSSRSRRGDSCADHLILATPTLEEGLRVGHHDEKSNPDSQHGTAEPRSCEKEREARTTNREISGKSTNRRFAEEHVLRSAAVFQP